MDIKANDFNAIIKAIEYYKRLLTDENKAELPKDAEKVFWDADIAIADTQKRRKAKTAHDAENMKKYRKDDPLYGRTNKYKEYRKRKAEGEDIKLSDLD